MAMTEAQVAEWMRTQGVEENIIRQEAGYIATSYADPDEDPMAVLAVSLPGYIQRSASGGDPNRSYGGVYGYPTTHADPAVTIGGHTADARPSELEETIDRLAQGSSTQEVVHQMQAGVMEPSLYAAFWNALGRAGADPEHAYGLPPPPAATRLSGADPTPLPATPQPLPAVVVTPPPTVNIAPPSPRSPSPTPLVVTKINFLAPAPPLLTGPNAPGATTPPNFVPPIAPMELHSRYERDGRPHSEANGTTRSTGELSIPGPMGGLATPITIAGITMSGYELGALAIAAIGVIVLLAKR